MFFELCPLLACWVFFFPLDLLHGQMVHINLHKAIESLTETEVVLNRGSFNSGTSTSPIIRTCLLGSQTKVRSDLLFEGEKV